MNFKIQNSESPIVSIHIAQEIKIIQHKRYEEENVPVIMYCDAMHDEPTILHKRDSLIMLQAEHFVTK